MHGVLVDGAAVHQPIEKPVKTAVLSVDVALGQLLGFGIGPPSEPPGPILEVRKVFLQVLGGDLLYIRPLLLRVEGSHCDAGFQAGQVRLGVPVGGLQAADEPFAVGTKTVVKNLLDDHASGGT